MSMDWFRWYHGTVSDPKLALIAKKSSQPRPVVIAIWAALLEHASQTEPRGDISDFDTETIAVALDLDDDTIPAVIAAMTAKGMIADDTITAWDRRQPRREDGAAERAKAWREKQKQPANTPNATERNRTQPNAGKRSDADADADEEEEVSQKRSVNAPAPISPVAPVANPTPTPPAPKAAKAAKAAKAILHPDWTPAESTYALLEKHGMDRAFAEGCVDEFRLYWRECGKALTGYETAFFNNVKRQWERKPATPTTTPRHDPHDKHARLAAANEAAIAEWLAQETQTVTVLPVQELTHATH